MSFSYGEFKPQRHNATTRDCGGLCEATKWGHFSILTYRRRNYARAPRYDLVLEDFGGDAEKVRSAYRKALIERMTEGKGVHDQVFCLTIIGGEAFITWLKGKFLIEE